jgi:hypothetical protein
MLGTDPDLENVLGPVRDVSAGGSDFGRILVSRASNKVCLAFSLSGRCSTSSPDGVFYNPSGVFHSTDEWGYRMLVALGLTFGAIVIAAAIHSELRSADYGIALSNGVEVLVSPRVYRAIIERFGALDEADAWQRWDQAVLDVLRPERPHEWKYLTRTLGYHVAVEGFGSRRRRSTVTR